MLLFKEGSGFVVTRDVSAQNIDDSIGVLEISARVHIVDEEPELDGRHTAADEDVFVSGVFCFHCLEGLSALFVCPCDVGIADAYGDAAALKHPVNEFTHIFVRLVCEESWLAVVVVAFERAEMLKVPALGKSLSYHRYARTL